jgi:hypothetical protein
MLPVAAEVQTAGGVLPHEAGMDAKPANRAHAALPWCALCETEDVVRGDEEADAPLGHTDPASTYWYLQATPELFVNLGRKMST